jgi:2-oxoisovalerate ferredoxin oxidoreductase beta subunit
MLALAIDELGIQDRTILISPVGCSVFAYYYFDVGNVQGAHGRAPAVATASSAATRKASCQLPGRRRSVGDRVGGDSARGQSRREHHRHLREQRHLQHDRRTGGADDSAGPGEHDHAGGTQRGERGLSAARERIAGDAGGSGLYRARGPGRQPADCAGARAMRRAMENQVRGLGFSLIEVLSPCPTIWKMSPVEAQHWVRDVMEKTYPLGGPSRSHQGGPAKKQRASQSPLSRRFRGFSASSTRVRSNRAMRKHRAASICRCAWRVWRTRRPAAGRSAGRGWTARGMEVSWLPSYGPEMRSGTSNCHVRLAREPIDSPLVVHPDVLVAMNEPSLHKFCASVRPGGWIFYNGDTVPEECERPKTCICWRVRSRMSPTSWAMASGQHGDAGRAAGATASIAAGQYRRCAGASW